MKGLFGVCLVFAVAFAGFMTTEAASVITTTTTTAATTDPSDVSTTTVATTTTQVDYKCPKANGYFADDKNCIKYIHCYENHSEEIVCPTTNGEQLLYNPDINDCDFQSRVSCGSRPICDKHDENCNMQPTPPPTTTRAPNQCDKLGSCVMEGELRQEGTCLPSFCECSQGLYVEKDCPDKAALVFNPSIGECDWPFNVPECN